MSAAKRIQVNIWQFCSAEELNVEIAKAAPEGRATRGRCWMTASGLASSRLELVPCPAFPHRMAP